MRERREMEVRREQSREQKTEKVKSKKKIENLLL